MVFAEIFTVTELLALLITVPLGCIHRNISVCQDSPHSNEFRISNYFRQRAED
jgi:hypothetical protein